MMNVRSVLADILARLASKLRDGSIVDIPLSIQTDPAVIPLQLYKSSPKVRSAPTTLRFTFTGSAVPELLTKLQKRGGHGDMTEMIAFSLRYYEAGLDAKERGNKVVEMTQDNQPVLRFLG